MHSWPVADWQLETLIVGFLRCKCDESWMLRHAAPLDYFYSLFMGGVSDWGLVGLVGPFLLLTSLHLFLSLLPICFDCFSW